MFKYLLSILVAFSMAPVAFADNHEGQETDEQTMDMGGDIDSAADDMSMGDESMGEQQESMPEVAKNAKTAKKAKTAKIVKKPGKAMAKKKSKDKIKK